MDNHAKISALLDEASETHHTVYRIVDGDDPDWASWYADWLLELSELPDLLGAKPIRSELVYVLVQKDKEFVTRDPGGRWQDFYATAFVDHFSS
ncbi:MAG: hypothetical protein ACR2MU_07600 [Gaiellaceae bacterium]